MNDQNRQDPGPKNNSRGRGDRSRNDRPRDNRPRDDRPRDDRPRGNRPRDDRPQEDRPRGNRPKGGDRSSRGGGSGRGGPNNNRNKRGGGEPRSGHSKGVRERPLPKTRVPLKPFVPETPKRYGVIFYDTFAQAKADLDGLAQKKSQYDQLNIVIRAEGNMDDPDLTPFGKVFAGTAWALIHDRRVADGWYNDPH